jgi:hypothetical protein
LLGNAGERVDIAERMFVGTHKAVWCPIKWTHVNVNVVWKIEHALVFCCYLSHICINIYSDEFTFAFNSIYI